MTSVKYDVSDVEAGGGGTEPTPGMYEGKIVSITHRTKKNDGTKISDLEVVVDIGPEYVRLWTYIKLPDDPSYENARWKLREFTDAVGLPPKGSLDPKKLEGKPVMVKTKMRRDDPERAEIKNLFKPGAESVKPGEAAAQEAAEQDYNSWTIEDLTAEIEERGLEVPSGRKSVAKLAAVLEEADAAEGEGGEEETPETDEDFDITTVEGYEDFAEWSKEDLQEELKTREITLEGRYSEGKARDAITEAVAAEQEGGDKPTEAAEGTTPEDDYDQWEDSELKEEIEDRNKQGAELAVTGRWTREKAIALMRQDDEVNPF